MIERKATMTGAQCSCGFTESGDEAIADHLLSMFTPDDDQGTDGRCHLEGGPALTCMCGLAAATAEELDAHFLAVFTPEGAIGSDGKKHEQVYGSGTE
jgi:hypothetical protein